MKVYITGGTGLLGSSLLRTVPKKFTLFSNYHINKLIPDIPIADFSYLDITNKKQVETVFSKIRPHYIIHTAAKSSPDFCEDNPQEAYRVNIEGTRNVLFFGNKFGSKVIIMSTNQVFSGINPPYTEESERDPVNVYGKTKVQNEDEILTGKYKGTVIRLMTLYGWGNPHGQKNSAMWVIDMLSKNQKIKVVDDIYNNFLWVEDASNAIWKMILTDKELKLIQIAGEETTNRYLLAKMIANVFKLDDTLITPVKKSYFKDEAPRPLNTVYDIGCLKKKLKFYPLMLKEGIIEMKRASKSVKWKKIA